MTPYAPPEAASPLRFADAPLTPGQFARIAALVESHAGIRVRGGKESFVRARLARRLGALGLTDFAAYLDRVEREGPHGELAHLCEALATHTTHFWREPSHFTHLRDAVLPELRAPVRLWSAGCATGEEAWTLAMLLAEARPDLASIGGAILATDLSRAALATASAGRYPAERLEALPAAWRERFWVRRAGPRGRDTLEAAPALRRLVRFEVLNLHAAWPPLAPFDVIFCRNVMIYFDKAAQQRLVDGFRERLRPGGHLYVGHSESLAGLTHRFRHLLPAAYRRDG